MQPNPSAETRTPLLPNLLVCITASLRHEYRTRNDKRICRRLERRAARIGALAPG